MHARAQECIDSPQVPSFVPPFFDGIIFVKDRTILSPIFFFAARARKHTGNALPWQLFPEGNVAEYLEFYGRNVSG